MKQLKKDQLIKINGGQQIIKTCKDPIFGTKVVFNIYDDCGNHTDREVVRDDSGTDTSTVGCPGF